MSNWSSTQLTDLGRALDAKVTAGTTLLSFTKMKLGSGTETAEDIPAMTDLVSPKLVLGISSCAVSASEDTICELISVASSSDVEDSFVVRELGVFATDPDVGEILYAVMLDSTPDTMPNENVSSPVTVTYQVNIVSDNASSITAVIDPAGLVNVATLNAAIADRLTREQTPACNKRDVIITSGTYTAPVTGWYKITVKGGGGGGNAGIFSSNNVRGGSGGGEGGTTIGFEKMSAGQTAAVVIGAGGTGGATATTASQNNTGGSGGDSTVTVNGITYTGGGSAERVGGNGTIPGAAGGVGAHLVGSNIYQFGGSGGGNGAGLYGSGSTSAGSNAKTSSGAGGGGGTGNNSTSRGYAGGNGGDGYVWFEYFDPSLN